MNYNLLGLFLSVFIHFWQQPLAHGGILDPRFPDYIVDPLVKCPDFGFFQHPRNCSWFYRCHGSVHLKGFYRRDYFECAPGTSFSNELKICDFSSFETCNDPQTPDCSKCDLVNVDHCENYDVCPDTADKESPVSLGLCENPTFACEGCTSSSPCKIGEWLHAKISARGKQQLDGQSTDLHTCYPSPKSTEMTCLPPAATTEPCNDCSTTVSRCRVYEICPNGDVPVNRTLCSVANNDCLPCNSSEEVCKDGEFFEMEDQKCYPPPDSMACHSCICSTVTSNCINYNLCPSGDNPGVGLNLCSNAENSCEPCGITTNVCPEGQFYSTGDQKCYPSPDAMVCPCNICTIETQNCNLHPNVCPTGKNPGVDMTLCSYAGNKCEPCGKVTNLCEGQLYSEVDQKCYPVNMTCPCDDCYISASRCQAHVVCPNGGPPRNLTLCPISKMLCDPCETESDVCPKGKLYAMETAICYPPLIDERMICNPKTQAIRDSPPIPSQDGVLNNVPALQCSGRNFLPQSHWIKEKFCKNYQPCLKSNGHPSGILELCGSYYECVYRVADESWTSVKKRCPGNQLFSYEAEKCVSEPENICRVF